VKRYSSHPVALAADRVHSQAGLGTAYWAAMGMRPVLVRQPDLPVEMLIAGMAASYGARLDLAVRRVLVPVVTLDFAAGYAVCAWLLRLWPLVIAERLGWEDVTPEVIALVRGVTLDDCFDPALWAHLAVLVEVEPDGATMPVRARFDPHGPDWLTGVGPLHADRRWLTLPDVVAAAVADGQPPRLIRAMRVTGGAPMPGLRPARLGGRVPFDPRRDDWWASVIHLRRRVEADDPDEGRLWKLVANTTAYGIWLRTDVDQRPGEEQWWEPSGTPHVQHVPRLETPGPWAFPPFGALVAGAGRLLVALAEAAFGVECVAYADTDSVVPIATRDGGQLDGIVR
jgi:hypothetical protein